MIKNILKMMKTSVRWSFNWGEWCPTEMEYKLAISCIQNDEKKRIGKFVFRKDERASLIGRLMMRKFINEYALLPYNEIKLTRDSNNRPVLKNITKSPINFNVSHQGNYTVLAGEIEAIKIGIDVMKLEYTGGKTLSEFFRIMERNFSSHEWKEIKGRIGTPESEQIAMFCRHWALKESYVKALGVGIVVDLRQLDFHTNSDLSDDKIVDDTVLYHQGSKKENWIFQETMIDSNHCVAVALENNKATDPPSHTKFKQLDFQSLMKHAVPIYPEDEQCCKEYFSKLEKPSHLK